MAGTPLRRERLKQATAAADEVRAELTAIRTQLIAKGLNPEDFGMAAAVEPPSLEAYSELLPRQILRLAGEGKAIEEIRVMLGFSLAQESEWANQYVDMAAALLRVRAREEAFWQGQARHLAASGDRAGFQAVEALIARRFHTDNSRGNAAALVHVYIGKPLDKRGSDDT